jgi:C1A family cysteine protease
MLKRLLKLLFGHIHLKSKRKKVKDKFSVGFVERDTPDSRDYRCSIVQIGELAESASIKNRPPIRNQETIGSCASHAAIRCYEIQLLNFKPNWYLEQSELFHYYNARKDNGTFPNDRGMTIREAMMTLVKYGSAMEYAWPYTVSKFNEVPPSYVYSVAHLYHPKQCETVDSIDLIKRSIMDNVAVVCGIEAWTSFWRVNESNMLYKPSGTYRGGHAVTIVAYDNVGPIFDNSWGIWNDNKGQFQMTWEDFQKYSFNCWRLI